MSTRAEALQARTYLEAQFSAAGLIPSPVRGLDIAEQNGDYSIQVNMGREAKGKEALTLITSYEIGDAKTRVEYSYGRKFSPAAG